MQYSESYQPAPTPYMYPIYDAAGGRDRYLSSNDHARLTGSSFTHGNTQPYQPMVQPVLNPQQQSHYDRLAPSTLINPAYQPHHMPLVSPMATEGSHASRPHDMPLISPLATEASHAASPDRAPSLVSDNQSTYSISPKTAPSPRPDMPAPIDTDIHAWARQLSHRRESPPNIPPQVKNQSQTLPDEGYVSALPHSAASDSRKSLPLPLQSLYRHESFQQSQSRNKSLTTDSGAAIPNFIQQTSVHEAGGSPRDTRMHLSNLLG